MCFGWLLKWRLFFSCQPISRSVSYSRMHVIHKSLLRVPEHAVLIGGSGVDGALVAGPLRDSCEQREVGLLTSSGLFVLEVRALP
jgi:hypothetical protein